MELNKKKGKFLTEVLQEWEKEGVLSPEESERLQLSFSISGFDWGKLAKYSFIIAISCAVIAFLSVLADDLFIDFIELITATEIGAMLFFSLIAFCIYVWGLSRMKNKPEKTFSNEAILFIGSFFVAVAIGYLGAAVDTGSGHFSLLFLLATILYVSLAIFFPSKSIWLLGLAAFSFWFGSEIAYLSGWREYILGMNYPFLYLLFSFLLVGLTYVVKQQKKLEPFYDITYVVTLIHLFGSLWILSMIGNDYDFYYWGRGGLASRLLWTFFLGAASFGAVFYGVKKEDGLLRIFGLTFFFINIYTKFFEYFWEGTHKAIFFLILAASFWLLGSRAEDIWSGKFLKGDDELLDV